MVLLVVAHAAIWYANFLLKGAGVARKRLWTFPDDRNVNMLTKEACDAVGTLTATCGNGHLIWIPAVQVVSMLWLPAMGLAAWRVRRANYELFKYAHLTVFPLYLVALYHAWNLWHYSIVVRREPQPQPQPQP